jgi:hypothetical protein
LEFSELPGSLRVQLTEEGRKELWHRVEEFGGIKNLSESFEFSQSKMYNWKNKELALPLTFVRRLMGENHTRQITLLKGRGSSGKIENPVFPLNVSEELLTRVNKSVKVNSDGTPVYLTNESSLADRFMALLKQLGKVQVKSYSRDSRYEIRFPKFLNKLFSRLDYDTHQGALIDEVGQINQGSIELEGNEIDIKDFNGKLYSKSKKFEIALQKKDSDKIAELMAEESDKAESLF